MAFLQVLLPSIPVLIVKHRILNLVHLSLLLPDYEYVFFVNIVNLIPDGHLERLRVDYFLCYSGENSEVLGVHKYYVELRDRESHWLLRRIHLWLVLNPLHVANYV